MTEKQLRKLNREQLLEILLSQQNRIDTLEAELKEAKAELDRRKIAVSKLGSIAEASLALTRVFEEAQKAADLYLENARIIAGTSGEMGDREEAQGIVVPEGY